MLDKAAVVSALEDVDESPRDVATSLQEFHDSALVLSRDHPRLIDAYPDQWVAVSQGTVLAHGPSLEQLLEKVDGAGVDRSEVIVRFIERTQRTVIL